MLNWLARLFRGEIESKVDRSRGGAEGMSASLGSIDSLLQLGQSLEDAGRTREALEVYQRAQDLLPDVPRVLLNVGNAYLALGEVDRALEAYERAIAVMPSYVSPYLNAASVHVQIGQRHRALQLLNRAVALDPSRPDAFLALGNVLLDERRFLEAHEAYEKGWALQPADYRFVVSSALALRAAGATADARSLLEHAARQRPDAFDVWLQLANMQREAGDLSQAVASCSRALDIDGDSVDAHSLLLFCLSNVAQGDGHDLILQAQERFRARCELPYVALIAPLANTKAPERILRVGFVSADLRQHAVTSFFRPVLRKLLEDDSLEVTIYDTGGPDDQVSKEMMSWVGSRWKKVEALDVEAFSARVRADGIDVLVDLSGHTPGHRLLAFARRVAPVQISWLGFPGSTGLRSMDYYVGDPYLIPYEKHDRLFTEKFIRLPCSVPFEPSAEAGDVQSLPAIRNHHFTFGSFNRIEKIGPGVVALWAQVLVAVPRAKLLLGGLPPETGPTEISRRFQDLGIDRARLLLHERTSMRDYMALHNQVDLCLDAFPYGGGTTSMHAAWMGVPTLTLVTGGVAGSSGCAVMSHLGLSELFVAQSKAQFLEISISWAGDRTAWEKLASIRMNLRQVFLDSRYMQPGLVASSLSRGIRAAWARWCSGLAPVDLDVRHDDVIAVQRRDVPFDTVR